MRFRSGWTVSAAALACVLTILIATSAWAQSGAVRSLAVSVDFDDVVAPCTFDQTIAVREEYAAQGVHFFGRVAKNGGGILNECGGFGVSGFSQPNFLAFNETAQYSDGGIPKPPQGVRFDAAYGHVQLAVGSIFSTNFSMGAFNRFGTLVGAAQITLTPSVRLVSVTATGIRSIRFTSAAEYWVVDDLEAS